MADYAIYVVAVALVAPLVFTLWFAAQVGWRQKHALGRYVHERSYDLVDDSVPEPLPPGTFPLVDVPPDRAQGDVS